MNGFEIAGLILQIPFFIIGGLFAVSLIACLLYFAGLAIIEGWKKDKPNIIYIFCGILFIIGVSLEIYGISLHKKNKTDIAPITTGVENG